MDGESRQALRQGAAASPLVPREPSQRLVHGLLLLLALWCAWLPAEVAAVTPLVIAVTCLALTRWGLARTAAAASRHGLVAAAVLLIFLLTGAATGWDRARAIQELGLLLAVIAVAWLASRCPPPAGLVTLLGLGLSLLACWGLWQVTVGFDSLQQVVQELPEHLREPYAQRLGLGRAFASLAVPGHLAIVLATALVLLLRRAQQSRAMAVLCWTGCGLCLLGIVLSQSLLGAGLGGCAVLAVLLRHRRRLAVALLGLLLLLALAVVAGRRADLLELEPIRLRADNWRTAVWVWSGAPVAGAGLGSFGQASQAVPFPVGNRPVHAHSLPLELLAELGPAGLGLVALLALWLWRLARSLWPQEPVLAVAVTLVPLHNLLDFSLYMSGVAVPWAVLLGWAVASQRAAPAAVTEMETTSAASRPHRWLLLTTACLALLLAAGQTASSLLERSAATGQSPEQARWASLLAPWRVPPAELLAISSLQSATPELLTQASQAMVRARWLRPQSARLASLQSRVLLLSDRPASAVAAAWLASRSQPHNQDHAESLDQLIELVGNGQER